MYTHGLTNGVDLVKYMQVGKNIKMHGSCLAMSNMFKGGPSCPIIITAKRCPCMPNDFTGF